MKRMNERIKQLMIEAGYAAPEIALRAQKFAELIVRECVDVVGKATASPNGYQAIMKHFGVEEQSTEPNGLHTCPYAEEIHGDYETLCDCNEEQQRQCAMDV